MSKRKTPVLRFRGFHNDWEQRKLGDIARIVGGGTPSTKNSQYWNGNINWYSPTEIGKNAFVNESKKKITKAGLQHSSAKLLPKDKTILFTSRANIGDLAIMTSDGATNQGFQSWVIDQLKIDIYFLYSLGNILKNQAIKLAYGSTFLEISNKNVKNLQLKIPNIQEQKKIGSLFKIIDELLTLRQRKLAKLKELKQGYLQKLFPKNGSKFPQLRFAGFADAWEERKLLDIADRFDNLRVPITASDRKSGDTPYYGANGIQDYVEGFTHDGEFILVAEDGANDLKNYPVQYVNGKVWVNNHAHVLQGKKTITDNKFLMNSIKNFDIEPFLVGGGRAKLNADVMMKLNILLPTFDEQEQIGSFFSLLDKTIALHQRKLEKLQELKKGYLQKMFC